MISREKSAFYLAWLVVLAAFIVLILYLTGIIKVNEGMIAEHDDLLDDDKATRMIGTSGIGNRLARYCYRYLQSQNPQEARTLK